MGCTGEPSGLLKGQPAASRVDGPTNFRGTQSTGAVMKLSKLLMLMFAAALPLYAADDEAAGAAPSSTEPAADQAQPEVVQVAAVADAAALGTTDTTTLAGTAPAVDAPAADPA